MASGPSENDLANAADAAAEALAFARRRVLVFWTFQVVFWTWVGLAIVGISRMYEPDRSISFPIVAARMTIGVLMSCCIHWIASSRLAQRFDWKMRWVIAAAATVLMLAVWLLMISDRFLGSVISGEGVRYFLPPYSRIFISGVWLAIYLGLDALQGIARVGPAGGRRGVSAAYITAVCLMSILQSWRAHTHRMHVRRSHTDRL